MPLSTFYRRTPKTPKETDAIIQADKLKKELEERLVKKYKQLKDQEETTSDKWKKIQEALNRSDQSVQSSFLDDPDIQAGLEKLEIELAQKKVNNNEEPNKGTSSVGGGYTKTDEKVKLGKITRIVYKGKGGKKYIKMNGSWMHLTAASISDAKKDKKKQTSKKYGGVVDNFYYGNEGGPEIDDDERGPAIEVVQEAINDIIQEITELRNDVNNVLVPNEQDRQTRISNLLTNLRTQIKEGIELLYIELVQLRDQQPPTPQTLASIRTILEQMTILDKAIAANDENIFDLFDSLTSFRQPQQRGGKKSGGRGGATYVMYNKRKYKVYVGKKGGKYILVGKDKTKVYV